MDAFQRHNAPGTATSRHELDSFLEPDVVQAMSIEDIQAALQSRKLDPQPSLDWVARKRNRSLRIFFLSSPALRVAAGLVLLVMATFLFNKPDPEPEPLPPSAIHSSFQPPLGNLYLTTLSTPASISVSLASTETSREEHIIDEASGPVPELFAKAYPFGKILTPQTNAHTAAPLEVIAFLDPDDSDSRTLFDDLQELAGSTSKARILFVPVSSGEVQKLLKAIDVESVPAMFINGNPILM